jgi:hypothetical protein
MMPSVGKMTSRAKKPRSSPPVSPRAQATTPRSPKANGHANGHEAKGIPFANPLNCIIVNGHTYCPYIGAVSPRASVKSTRPIVPTTPSETLSITPTPLSGNDNGNNSSGSIPPNLFRPEDSTLDKMNEVMDADRMRDAIRNLELDKAHADMILVSSNITMHYLVGDGFVWHLHCICWWWC